MRGLCGVASVVEGVEEACPGGVSQSSEGPLLYLSYPFPCYSEQCTDLFQSTWLFSIYAEVEAQDSGFALADGGQCQFDGCGESSIVGFTVWWLGEGIREEVHEPGVLAGRDWCVEREVGLCEVEGLLDLFVAEVEVTGDLFDGWFSP